jgi:hypothetical protein
MKPGNISKKKFWHTLCRRHCRRRSDDQMGSVPSYAEGLAIGVCPLYAEGLAVGLPICETIWRATERMPRAPVRRGRGRRRSSGWRLDLTWAHSSALRAGTPKAGRGRRHSHHTPRASATPTAITVPPRAVYAEELRRGLPSV